VVVQSKPLAWLSSACARLILALYPSGKWVAHWESKDCCRELPRTLQSAVSSTGSDLRKPTYGHPHWRQSRHSQEKTLSFCVPHLYPLHGLEIAVLCWSRLGKKAVSPGAILVNWQSLSWFLSFLPSFFLLLFFSSSFFFFWKPGTWTQGLRLARQVHYHLSHAHTPFLL
jgi:hypothetical protein